jgi:AbrB family looped-hinge helix DNA binding protein
MKREATITEKGQVTIPKVIRDKLGLKKGKKSILNCEVNFDRGG